ncbi:hypothetical protein GCM10028807_59750 [Spirosoma daeguense]
MNGTLPASIGKLDKLQSINIGFESNLTGPIPESIRDLHDLKSLGIIYSGISGTVFDKIIGLTQLEAIYLSFTKIIDTIPENIGALPNLKYIYFFGNQSSGFTGKLPTNLGALTNLQHLALVGNLLTGPIPASVGQLSNLEVLYLDSNQLTGSIPNELGNLAKLRDISLSSNQLTGDLPPSLGSLPNLRRLQLYWNQLSGNIPSSYSALCGKEVNISENPGLQSWGEFCADGINIISSVKDGNWHDPTVWSTGQVPTLINNVILQHNVAIPASQAGQSRKISYRAGGRLNYGTGSNLRIGQ